VNFLKLVYKGLMLLCDSAKLLRLMHHTQSDTIRSTFMCKHLDVMLVSSGCARDVEQEIFMN
jgi:hypothetical protein